MSYGAEWMGKFQSGLNFYSVQAQQNLAITQFS